MILSKEKINRYLRHIIMPEISGIGQKEITKARIYLYAATVNEASSLIYYLAASGIGFIYCYFKDNNGYDSLYKNTHDLNEDVIIKLCDNELPITRDCTSADKWFICRILISKYEDLSDNLISFSSNLGSSKFMPTIISINAGWNGFLQTFCNKEDFDSFFAVPLNLDISLFKNDAYNDKGTILSDCLLGTLTSVECIKLCLNIGTILDKPLCFNLLYMKFHISDNKIFHLVTSDFVNYVNCENPQHVDSKKINNDKKLSNSKVLIVGVGGLGSPVAYALSHLGIGTIGFVDYDKVEISNLNRQILHSFSRIGMLKVESAKVFIKNINPNVNVLTYNTSINVNNAFDIIKDYDVVIDGVDNFPSRYLLNDACFFLNKPLVDAAAVRYHGLIMTILPNKGPCYRCVFPTMPSNAGKSCSEAGVLGPVPGVMGFIQAAEIIKLLLNLGDTLHNRIIYYDALDSDFDTVNMNKSPSCGLCGTNPTITTLTQYNKTCETNNNNNNNNKGIS